MYSVKKPLLGLILAGFLGTATAAPVSPGYIGILTTPVLISNSFSSATASFSDVYTFTLASTSSTTGTAISLDLDFSFIPGTEYEIDNFMVELLDSTGFITYDSDNESVEAILLPGNYQFVVSGEVTGTFGGVYAGALAATPIPEPNKYAMLLAGLGLIGFVVTRRRSL